MFSLKNKVWLLDSKKTDGRYNKGIIVGIELRYDGLGYLSEAQYFREHQEYRYKVAYVDVFTGKAGSVWTHFTNLSKTKPEDCL